MLQYEIFLFFTKSILPTNPKKKTNLGMKKCRKEE